MANSCENYAREQTGRYILNRMVRILPLYYSVILYYFAVHTFLLKDVPADPQGYGWLRYFLLLNGLVPQTDMYFWDNLGITWTIPCFFCAYLWLPLALKWVRNYRGAMLLCLLTGLFSMMVSADFLGGYFVSAKYQIYFAMGVVIFYSYREKKQWLTGILLGVLMLLRLITGRDIVKFVLVMMVLVTENMSVENSYFCRILQIIDRYSYTMYLAHGVVFIHLLDRYSLGILRPFVAVLGSVVLTILINRYLETPIQAKIKQLMKSTK